MVGNRMAPVSAVVEEMTPTLPELGPVKHDDYSAKLPRVLVPSIG